MKKIEELTNRFICGDSMEVMKTIPSDSTNLIITSPPYFGCRVYGNETVGREQDPLAYVEKFMEFSPEIKRILHLEGSFYLNVGDVYFGTKGFGRVKGKFMRKTHEHYKEHEPAKEDGKYLQNKQLLLIPPRMAIRMQEEGWILRNQIIWQKPNACPNVAKDRKMPVYEYIYHFVKSRKYYYDYEASNQLGHYKDIVNCKIEPFGEHEATFPESLIDPFIQISSKKGDVVLDPFGGWGTVALVADRLERQYISIEINKKFCEGAEERLSQDKLEWLM